VLIEVEVDVQANFAPGRSSPAKLRRLARCSFYSIDNLSY